jgi:alpha-1,2-mannosyltransferase
MWHVLLGALAVLGLLLALLVGFLRRRSGQSSSSRFTVGFFHPFCNSGGGGERVLWQYIRILQQQAPDVRVVIYTGDVESSEAILARTLERFGIAVEGGEAKVTFVRLKLRKLMTAEAWPRFTMVGQSIGAAVLACEALWRCPCSLFIDTTGAAFTYPLAKGLFGTSVHCYTHYPTISSDMLRVVYERRPAHNNAGSVQRSWLLARAKWLYYKLFALAYAWAGRSAELVFVNSSWTRGHIDSLWGGSSSLSSRIHTVYPPCDTKSLQQLPLGLIRPWTRAGLTTPADELSSANGSEPVREDLVVSLAQFRPEKDHALQLRSFARFRDRMRSRAQQDDLLDVLPHVTLVLIGGVRDEGDAARVAALRSLASELGLVPDKDVVFELNQPYSVVQSYLSRCTAALHSMWNEHFGIGVVEFLAAGAVTVAHDSGGPAMDIVVRVGGQPTGYRATSEAQYADALTEIFASDTRGSHDMHRMRTVARAHAAEKFSDEVFEQRLHELLVPFVRQKQREWLDQSAATTAAAAAGVMAANKKRR